MPRKGTGRYTREEWKSPTPEMRESPKLTGYVSKETKERYDALLEGTRSGHLEAALRDYFGLPRREDAPPRPK